SEGRTGPCGRSSRPGRPWSGRPPASTPCPGWMVPHRRARAEGYPTRARGLGDQGGGQVDAVVHVGVHTAADAVHEGAIRVLPKGPPVTTPVVAGNGRSGSEPVGDPQQAVAALGEVVRVPQ